MLDRVRVPVRRLRVLFARMACAAWFLLCVAPLLIPVVKLARQCGSPDFRVSYADGVAGTFKGSGSFEYGQSSPYHAIHLDVPNTGSITILLPLNALPGTYPFSASHYFGDDYLISVKSGTISAVDALDYSDLASGSLTLEQFDVPGGFWRVSGSFEATFHDRAGQSTTFRGTFDLGECEWLPCKC